MTKPDTNSGLQYHESLKKCTKSLCELNKPVLMLKDLFLFTKIFSFNNA